MKFGKELEQRLVHDDIPEEWVEAAIQYKALKKCINLVVHELEFLGLTKTTLKLMLDEQGLSHEVNLDEAQPSNPLLAQYTLTKSKGDHSIVPVLKIAVDDMYTDEHLREIGTKLREMGGGAKIVELKQEGGELVLTPTHSHDGIEAVEETMNGDGEVARPKEGRELVILLDADTRFFLMLDLELLHLDKLRSKEENKLQTECTAIAQQVALLLRKNGDLYKWRELFRIYLDSEVYFRYNETSLLAMERDSAAIKRNLEGFMTNVAKLGFVQEFKNKRLVTAFNEFMTLNFHLLKMLQFQLINTTALRKILKKFDKQTNLGVSRKFPKLNDHVFLTGTLIAQLICCIMQLRIVLLVPQLEDYLCPVCMLVAYKPIRLRCSHLFCVRCLVKMKQQQKVDCPICRSPGAIAVADGSNLDISTMELMQQFFPVEIKEKLKDRDRERFKDFKGTGDKCVLI